MAHIDEFHVRGNDGIIRTLDEHYDTLKDVEQDPYGAWLAIQNLWENKEELEAKLVHFANMSIGYIESAIEDGCPNCGGDCSSANPPPIFCPVQEFQKDLSEARAALKEIEGDG